MGVDLPKTVILAVGSLLLLGGLWACRYSDLGHADVEKIPRLHGKSLAVVVNELGDPNHTVEFPMSEAVGEFRVELYNTYPPSDPSTAAVRIKELQWDRPGYHITVWFHKIIQEWRVLDTCRWKEGVQF